MNRIISYFILVTAFPVVFLLCGGCNSVSIFVEKSDGTKYHYEREGDNMLEGVHVKTSDGTEIDIGKQESNVAGKALDTVGKAIDKIPNTP